MQGSGFGIIEFCLAIVPRSQIDRSNDGIRNLPRQQHDPLRSLIKAPLHEI